jgi:hypothetical protein
MCPFAHAWQIKRADVLTLRPVVRNSVRRAHGDQVGDEDELRPEFVEVVNRVCLDADGLGLKSADAGADATPFLHSPLPAQQRTRPCVGATPACAAVFMPTRSVDLPAPNL